MFTENDITFKNLKEKQNITAKGSSQKVYMFVDTIQSEKAKCVLDLLYLNFEKFKKP